MQPQLATAIVLFSTLTISCSYPVFGTKRYTRANLIPPHDLSSMSMPAYPAVPQYYDTPQYAPAPSYNSEYYDDGYNYFYYPQQMQRRLQRQDRYLSYGLPTYRGEYRPSTYYYAHGPSYTFSDDHVESTNPMDDLHEEIMQEDERERAHEYYPVGQEQWYENPTKPDSNNNFLRTLLRYNNQVNAYKPYEYNNEEEFEDEEYEDPEATDYYDSPVQESYNSYASYNPFTSNNYQSSMRASQPSKDDEEVEELKSLISQQKNNKNYAVPSVKQHNSEQYISQDWQKDASAYNSPSFSEYDPEYDDSWINWDKKRSLQPKKMDHPKMTTTTTAKPSTTIKPSTTKMPQRVVVTSRPKSLTFGSDHVHHGGQKEVVLPRPATPVRNGFAAVLKPSAKESASKEHDKAAKQTKNIYDTIKQMIDMEKNLEVIEYWL
jgi:hypothetical protein